MKIKICGINSVETAMAAVQGEVDYLGLIFAPHSPRRVTLTQAMSIASTVRTRTHAVALVAVFKDNPLDEIRAVVAQLKPDVVQLHGVYAAELARALHDCGCQIWCDARATDEGDMLLVDSPQPGSGMHADWSRAKQLTTVGKCVVLAGGLGVDNLRAAMHTGATILDINSTLEDVPGHKSVAKITQLLQYFHTLQHGNRIEQLFAECRMNGRKVFAAFMPIGFPTLALSERAVATMLENGAGIIEFGVPCAEPTADGAVIRDADRLAIENGTTLDDVLQCIKRLRQRFPATPFVLFSYFASIQQYGVEQFAESAAAAGVDAVLVVDAPAGECAVLQQVLRTHSLTMIPLLPPNVSPNEIAQLTAGAEDSFIYAINFAGTTGERKFLPKELPAHLDALRGHTTMPILAGFGISTPEQAAILAEHADGFVVGSALVKILLEYPDDHGLTRLASLCTQFGGVGFL
jgi:tryptophan synthase alpha chain